MPGESHSPHWCVCGFLSPVHIYPQEQDDSFELLQLPSRSSRTRSLKNFFLIKFYWSTVVLQCCVTFCCTAKWVSYTHKSILSVLMSRLPQSIAFPGLSRRLSLRIYFVRSISSVCMWIPVSQFFPPPHSPLSTHTFVLYTGHIPRKKHNSEIRASQCFLQQCLE